ncbi:MAG: hypothetical protein A2V85_12130 [Chloroflexi bacterium RBG_16_72_14]|nr:MAG: hypothetical protein A2V85_12130 [Chloroflexi bacterium RBG_16_72_14]
MDPPRTDDRAAPARGAAPGAGNDHIARLQAFAGNAAVSRLLAQRQVPQHGPTPATTPTPGAQTPATAPAAGGPTATPMAGGPTDDKARLEAILARIEKDFDPAIRGHRLLKERNQRIRFLDYMRPFFGSDDATVDHFARITPAAIPGSTTLLHEAVTTRLLSVAGELGGRMPTSDGNGWAFRAGFDTGSQDVYDLHRIGMAIDYNAAEMPHLGKRRKKVDPRQLDLISIVTGRAATMNLGVSEAKLATLLKEMGEASISSDPAARQNLEKPEAVALLATVRAEAEALERASATFQASLGDKGAELVKLQKDYFAASDPKVRAELFAKVPGLVATWKTQVDAAVDKMDADIAAVGAKVDELPTGAALTKADKVTERTRTAVTRLLQRLKRPRARLDLAAARKVIAPARTSLGEPEWALVTAAPAGGPTGSGGGTTGPTRASTGGAPDAAPAAAPAADARTQVVTELERLAGRLGDRQTALRKKAWRDRVVAVRDGLASDPSFVLGEEDAKKGRPKVEVGLPPLAQLVDRGFYATRGTSKRTASFGVDFVEAMVRHGFHPGSRFANPDSMHFELPWPGGR